METEREEGSANAEGLEAVKKENEELKEVLSAVQIDLENNQEVSGCSLATPPTACH